jgi:two-component system, NtrC family, sensor kinase
MKRERKGIVFDPFFTTKHVDQGTGLGLSISYGIIKDHHGKIDVTDTGPTGTSVRIRLPVWQPNNQTRTC